MPYLGSDSFKTYPLRFAGYGFGVAEALSGLVSYPVVNGFRTVAFGFIFAHTIFRPVEVAKKTNSSMKMVTSATDTFLYELVVSGIIPPAVAFQMKKLAYNIPCPASWSTSARAWLPAGVALASLPIIIPPCDGIVDTVMDVTIRQLYP